MPFKSLGLSDAIQHVLKEKGYTEPSPIQQQTIPIILEGHDLIATAQTGTGKTAAFALPTINKIKNKGLHILVIEPTRELAEQVQKAYRTYGKFMNLDACLIQGGESYNRQRAALQRNPHVIVATPGRLLDHIQQGTIKLQHIKTLVLDEFDRLIDMGFLPDVRKIINHCPKDRQTLLFSATIPGNIKEFSAFALKHPKTIQIGGKQSPAETINHAFYPVPREQKVDLLKHLLSTIQYQSLLIFTRTRRGADNLARTLNHINLNTSVLHSDRSQAQRRKALEAFQTGRTKVMIATDIAARGIDIQSVSHVINFDVPEHPEDYVHRIGRTGRAKRQGEAITFVTGMDHSHVRSINKFIGGEPIKKEKVEGFQYSDLRLFEEDRKHHNGPSVRGGGNRPAGGGRGRRGRFNKHRGGRTSGSKRGVRG